MDKKIENYTYEELVNYVTGLALMEIGAGTPFRKVVNTIAYMVNYWTAEALKKNKKEG